jgi:DNA-binding NarL/FixJ family response regulator
LNTNFTEKEKTIIKLLSKGLSNLEIANSLNITEDTVKVHIKHILNKLDFERRGQIIAYYFESKIESEKN